MGSRKTRYTILRDGVEQLLFSVEERKSGPSKGDLLLFFPRSGYIEDGMTGTLEKAQEHRISVHVSPSAKGHLINGHLQTEDVGHRNAAAYIEFDFNHPVWLLQTISPGGIAPDGAFKAKGGDTVRRLGDLDSTFHTLLCMIWLSRADLPPIENGRPIFIEDFSIFRLMLMFHKIPLMSIDEGYYAFSATSPRLTNGVPDDRKFSNNIEALSPVEASFYNHVALHKASLATYRKFRRVAERDNFDLTDLPDNFLRVMCCLADGGGPIDKNGNPDLYPIADPYHPDFDIPIDPPIKPPAIPL